MTMKWRILVVDDDAQIGELIQDYLQKHGYSVDMALDGMAMQRKLKEVTYDLLILDVMLPGEDGISICRRLREESDMLIIMLSAMGEDADKVIGLEVGADDYLSKPFSPRELLARMKSLERRIRGPLAEKRKTGRLARMPHLKFMDWVLDQNKRRLISPDEVVVPLSAAEYDLLLAFLEHPQRVLTRDQLLDITRSRQSNPYDRTIDVQVARLRKKIEQDSKNPQIIVTVRGGGYQFNADVSLAEDT